MADYKAEVTLNEKDTLQDMLNLEKEIVKVYSTAMTEATSKGFRALVQEHWTESANDQLAVFMMMTDHDYARVQSAPETVLSEEKNKFCKVKSQLA